MSVKPGIAHVTKCHYREERGRFIKGHAIFKLLTVLLILSLLPTPAWAVPLPLSPSLHTATYDRLNQMTVIAEPPGAPFPTATLTYDKVGNRTKRIAGPTTLYTANPLNQYTAGGGVACTSDANGNLTTDGTRTLTYDSEAHLTTAVLGPTTVTATYDPLGRRLTQTVNGVTTRYLYDGDPLPGPWDGT